MLTAQDYTVAEMVEIQGIFASANRRRSEGDTNPLALSWMSKQTADHWRALASRAITASEAEGKAATAREFDERAEEQLTLSRKLSKLNQEAVTMTTTPATTQRPPISATVPESKSPALIAVENLGKTINERMNSLQYAQDSILNRTDATDKDTKAIRAEISALRADVTAAHRMIEGLCELLQKQPAAQTATPQAAPDAHGNGVVVFHCDTIEVGWDDKAKKIAYKAKGGRYAMHGVRVWPEVLPVFGIVAKDHTQPGESITIDRDVRAELAEVETTNKETGEIEKKMVARKVIGLA
jgi:hypothetical protein